MKKKNNPARIVLDPVNTMYACEGAWTIFTVQKLSEQFAAISHPTAKRTTINGKSITHMDSAGALALLDCLQTLKTKNTVELCDFTAHQQKLLDLVADKKDNLTELVTQKKRKSFLHKLGESTIAKLEQATGLLKLIGNLSQKFFTAITSVKRLQFPSIVANIYICGITALPILALLSFLIGVVLAYQMGLQLETYGANIYIAYLSGLAVFREFGPLITAIIVAGRTSSAFTAQIGSMKINEEIDALYTMGLSPIELLVMPKILGLFIIFPLLIFWSNIFSILGAMLMSKSMLQIGYIDFLVRLRDSVGLKQMMLGLYKSPAFSLIIALVGCFQGFRVERNAQSIGAQTTKSVVQALFLIIIADSAYSIVYSWMKL